MNWHILLNWIENTLLFTYSTTIPNLPRIFLPQKSKNVRPHSSNSIENATPF